MKERESSQSSSSSYSPSRSPTEDYPTLTTSRERGHRYRSRSPVPRSRRGSRSPSPLRYKQRSRSSRSRSRSYSRSPISRRYSRSPSPRRKKYSPPRRRRSSPPSKLGTKVNTSRYPRPKSPSPEIILEYGRTGPRLVKEESPPPIRKEKPNYGLSGKLAEEANALRGVPLKYSEPSEAQLPNIQWRLYVFKKGEQIGRDFDECFPSHSLFEI